MNPEIIIPNTSIQTTTRRNLYAESVILVRSFLQQRELENKTLSQAVTKRLEDLREGKSVPFVIFNCINFDWITNGTDYPQVIAQKDTTGSIAQYYQKDILEIMNTLQTIGNPELIIVIPDSELIDDRAFSYNQTIEDRTKIGKTIQDGLTTQLQSLLEQTNGRVVFWSNYCNEQGLPSPLSYTSQNYERIMNDPMLQKKVRDQVKDSRKYFQRMGLNAEPISQQAMDQYIAWYLAMYAGEGEALADMQALVFMPEDGRVPAWFLRGAEKAGKELAIIKPVDPMDYFKGRRKSS
jgi:hypothetical protein